MSLGRRPWVAVLPVGLAAGGIALAIVLTSDSQHTSPFEGVLQLLLGWSFIGTGLFAWARRPHNRTGQLMVGVGFVWFLGALSFADSSLPYTLGNAVGALSLAVFIHLLFAFPNGHLESRAERVLVGLGVSRGAAREPDGAAVRLDADRRLPEVPFERLPRHRQPYDGERARAVLELRGRRVHDRRRRPARAPLARVERARRGAFSAPVYVGGLASLLIAGARLRAHRGDERRRHGPGVGLIGFMSVPFLFLAGLLRTRLARTSATQLLQETGESPPLEEAEAALRRLLNDPTLRLLVREDGGGFVDTAGRSVEPPPASATEAVTPLEYEGEPIAVVVHDPALRDEPELLDDVLAAARVALVKDRSVQALRASERRNRALLAAIPDNMFRIRGDGTYVDFHTNRPEALAMPADTFVGSRIDDHLPAEKRRDRPRHDPPRDRDRRPGDARDAAPRPRRARRRPRDASRAERQGRRARRSRETSPTASAPSSRCCASATS